MIRTNSEYADALRRLHRDREVIAAQREQLRVAGLGEEEVQRAIQPALAFHQQLQDEVETYERIKRRDFPIVDFAHVGRMLVALRIAADITQAELARRLGVSESMVSRDERNEYHGVTLDRAQRVVDALRGRVSVRVEQDVDDATLAVAMG